MTWVTTAPRSLRPMHRVDVKSRVWREVPRGTDDAVSSSGANDVPRRWSIVHRFVVPSGSCRLNAADVSRDDRPRVCVERPLRRRGSGRRVRRRQRRCRRASNSDARRDPLVGVDLGDAEHLGVERLGPLVRPKKRLRLRARRSPRVAMTSDVMSLDADLGGRPQACDLGISTASDAGVHDATAIVDRDVVGIISAMASQSRAAKCVRNVRPPGLPRFPAAAPAAELVEPGERGVDVCLVEESRCG